MSIVSYSPPSLMIIALEEIVEAFSVILKTDCGTDGSFSFHSTTSEFLGLDELPIITRD